MDYTAFQSQQAKLDKRRALAQMLQQQGLEGPQGAGMVSGRYVRSGIAAALAPLLQAGIGTYVGSKADKEAESLNKQQSGDVDKALLAYQNSQPTDRQASLQALSSQVAPPQDRAKLLIAQAMAPKPEIIRDLDPTKYTAESLQKFSTSRNYADLIAAPADESPSGASMSPLLQAYNVAKKQGYKGSVLEFQKELSTSQANYPYAIAEINGVKTLVDRTTGAPMYGPTPPGQAAPAAAAPPGGGAAPAPIQYTAPTAGPRQIPLTTLAQEAAAGSELKRQEAAGGALGKAQGEIAGGIQTKGANADVVTGMLDEADKLVDQATGSAGGAALDATQAMFGGANQGSKAIARLKVLQSGLMLNAPRMEGPQSDRDVQLYREAAGQIGDPMTPREIKKAALSTVRSIQQKYQQRAVGAGAPAAVGVPAIGGAPVKVSTPQEAMALPPGTKFITPDGRVKVR